MLLVLGVLDSTRRLEDEPVNSLMFRGFNEDDSADGSIILGSVLFVASICLSRDREPDFSDSPLSLLSVCVIINSSSLSLESEIMPFSIFIANTRSVTVSDSILFFRSIFSC